MAYILQPGDLGYIAGETHGLIVALSDQGTNIGWSNGKDITTGATGMLIGSGSINTNTIIGTQGDGKYAAKLCSDLVLNGFGDCYLPSINELSKVSANKAAIGVFSTIPYWSSSEVNRLSASAYSFHVQSGVTNYPKSMLLWVRAIRSF